MAELSLPPKFLNLPIHRLIDCSGLWGEYPPGSEIFGLKRELPSTADITKTKRWEALKILGGYGMSMTSPLRELWQIHAQSGNPAMEEASEKLIEEISERVRALNPAGAVDNWEGISRGIDLEIIARSLEEKEEGDSLGQYRHHLDDLYRLASTPPTTIRAKMKRL